MSELQYDYALWNEDGRKPWHAWSVVGEKGGVHIWAAEQSAEFASLFGDRFYGGVECHWRNPQYTGCEVSQDDCWLLKGPCYHDGSSLYFSEKIEPMLRAIEGETVPDDIHEYMKAELADWYRSRIGGGA